MGLDNKEKHKPFENQTTTTHLPKKINKKQSAL